MENIYISIWRNCVKFVIKLSVLAPTHKTLDVFVNLFSFHALYFFLNNICQNFRIVIHMFLFQGGSEIVRLDTWAGFVLLHFGFRLDF